MTAFLTTSALQTTIRLLRDISTIQQRFNTHERLERIAMFFFPRVRDCRAINVADVIMALVTIVAIGGRDAGRFNIDSRNNEKVHSLER